MAETEHHRKLMTALIETLERFYQDIPLVHVSGNLLLFYEQGNKRRHVSPDVFVVKGVDKALRDNYLVWEEGKAPDLVIELTSSSTRKEDTDKKFKLYRDRLKVKEYFLFDPKGDYLDPPLRGYRLRKGAYHPIRPVKGRLPSQVLGLHLERNGEDLRLFDPATGQWLPTPQEWTALQAEARRQAEEAQRREAEARRQEAEARRQAEERERAADESRRQAEERERATEEARRQAEAEAERLRGEIEELRRRLGKP